MKTKFCLESVASFQQINGSSINKSPSKHTFTFSKGDRFEQPKANCPRTTYGGDFLSKKPSATSIGFGKKSDFTRCLTVSPSAGKYKLKSFWDQNISRKKGPSFALNRDKVSFNTYISKQLMTLPSPAHYSNQKKNKERAPLYSIRKKTIQVDKTRTIQSQNDNPGPGSYINPEMQSSNSSKNVSKFRKVSYSQPKSKRFGPSETFVPGPGNYKEKQSLSKAGIYLLSQNKGGTKAKFDINKRQSFFDTVFKKQLTKPGPGYYQAPSQFGRYDGNVYTEWRDTKRSNQNGWKIVTERLRKR